MKKEEKTSSTKQTNDHLSLYSNGFSFVIHSLHGESKRLSLTKLLTDLVVFFWNVDTNGRVDCIIEMRKKD